MRLHGNKKRICEYDIGEGAICGKQFVAKSAYDRHQKVHLGNRDIECPICKAGFYSKESWKKHYRIQHINFKMECFIQNCKSEFSRKELLRKHIQSCHFNYGPEVVDQLLQRVTEIKLPEVKYEDVVEQYSGK
jgi:uncharacterized Zn-finger protein